MKEILGYFPFFRCYRMGRIVTTPLLNEAACVRSHVEMSIPKLLRYRGTWIFICHWTVNRVVIVEPIRKKRLPKY